MSEDSRGRWWVQVLVALIGAAALIYANARQSPPPTDHSAIKDKIEAHLKAMESLTGGEATENDMAFASLADSYPRLAIHRICETLDAIDPQRVPPKKSIVIHCCSVLDKLTAADSKDELITHGCLNILQRLQTDFANDKAVAPSLTYTIDYFRRWGVTLK